MKPGGQFKANAIREQLDGAYGETYAYAKLNRKHNEVCQQYCSQMEDVLEALDVIAENSVFGTALTALTLMGGSSAVSELIAKVRGEQ